MAGRFTARKGLDQIVAARIAGPAVARIADAGKDAAQRAAPGEKTWLTELDDAVRKEHREAHGQAVPDNLRFTLAAPAYDQAHYRSGEIQMGRAPRDEDNFTPGLTAQCRCQIGEDPAGVSRTIDAKEVHVEGTRASSRVVCDHHLAYWAEYGNDQDVGARYMAKGLQAARRAAHGRD